MHIDTIPNRKSTPTVLVRRSYREGGKVKKQTLSNITRMPPEYIEVWRGMMRGELRALPKDGGFSVERTLPHGHVAAVVGMVRKLGVDRMLDRTATGKRALVVGMLAARLLNPCSKLATARGLGGDTVSNSLGETLGITNAKVAKLYEALDWLVGRQRTVERQLARKHLREGSLVLYDLTSAHFEGQSCPFARYGHPRCGKRGKPRLEFGLLCNEDGCPVAVEVFDGNVADPSTLCRQIEKLRKRFSLSRVVLVGDRGMLTNARIRQEIEPAGYDWISALRNGAVAKLAKHGTIQPSLFDETDLAEVRDEKRHPGERLMVCKNPLLAEERKRKREELLARTEEGLEKIAEQTRRERRPLRGEADIRVRLDRVLKRHKVGKHFQTEVRDDGLHYRRDEERIAAEAALDGIYVVRTSVEPERLDTEKTVAAYKSLSRVERAFRCIKGGLQVRPIGHRLADRVRAHVFLCMLAYYVEWHMRERLAPKLFVDDDRKGAEEQRRSVVAPAQPSPSAKRKARTRHRPNGKAVHSFESLLENLATICKNRIRVEGIDAPPVEIITNATDCQREVFDLLDVRLK